VPEYLVYELMDDIIAAIKSVLNNAKFENIMGSSALQSVIISFLFIKSLNEEEYWIMTNEMMFILDHRNNLSEGGSFNL